MINSIALFKNCVCYSDTYEYEKLTDIELIQKIREGDENAERYLYVKYSFLVRKMVSAFFILGAEKDDLFQEAMIGFIKAVKNYNLNLSNNFKFYAELCIRRQIISAIRKTRSYRILNIISIYEINNQECDDCIVDKIPGKDDIIPENVLIQKEEINDYKKIASDILSKFEKEVLNEYSMGKTYEEISFILKKDAKSIDNAVQRIKKKISKNKEKIVLS